MYSFLYDQNGNIVQFGQSQLVADAPLSLVTYPDTDTTAPDALQHAAYYKVINGSLVKQPYFTITYANGTVTATLNNPPTTPPTSVAFLICGQTYNEPLTNGSASIAVNLHPSITNQTINVTASASGCVSGSLNIGGTHNDVGLQSFVPSGSTSPTVAPSGTGSKAFLSDYWTSTAVNDSYSSADIGTWLGMLLQSVYGIILPKLTGGTSPIVTLDANQQNAVSDITTNLLPNILTTLENAAPVPASGQPQKYDLHYAHAVHTFAATKAAMNNYVNDLSTIPNLA